MRAGSLYHFGPYSYRNGIYQDCVISGISAQDEKWRACVEETNIAFSFAVSAMYVRETFHGDSKVSVSFLVSHTHTHAPTHTPHTRARTHTHTHTHARTHTHLFSRPFFPHRGVAKNLLWEGTKEGSGNGSQGPPAGVQGQSPGGVLERSPRSRGDTCWIFDWTKYIKFNTAKIVLFWKNFQLRRGTCTHVPLGYATVFTWSLWIRLGPLGVSLNIWGLLQWDYLQTGYMEPQS